MEIRLTGFFSLFILCLVILTGCETTLDLPVTEVPRLTILSHLSPGSAEKQRVYVYASQSPGDSSNFYTPEDIKVDITEIETDHTITLDRIINDGKTYFEFPTGFLKEGYSYRILAFAPGFDIVQASTEIPRPSTIENLIVKDFTIEQPNSQVFKRIIRYKVEFDINHVEPNRYYHLVFTNQYRTQEEASIIDPESSDDQPFIQHYAFGVLIDKEDLEDGKKLSFNFKDKVINDNDLQTVSVELRTITAGYYKYHTTLTRQLLIRDDPFAEPVIIFNNIDGGYGNFSAFSPNITSSDLPQ